jgi:hypothetical protein
MPHSPELLRRYSLQLLANAQELRRQAAAARERSAKCKALAREACLVAQTARAMADAMRKRQGRTIAAREQGGLRGDLLCRLPAARDLNGPVLVSLCHRTV